MIIRRAVPDDFADIFELIKDLWSYNKYDFDKTFDIYKEIISKTNSFAYVVIDNSEIVGFCHGDFFPTLWMCGKTCYLSGIITDNRHRNKGIGKFMLNHVRTVAKESNCKAIILDSGLPRTGAHKFYEKFGFEKSCYGFEMAI